MKRTAAVTAALLLATSSFIPGVLATLPETVRIETGLVSGVDESGGVRAFKGIPFAAPPLGERRWKAPEPPPSWQGVRQASAFSARCMQGGGGADQPPVSEDCLYLNVWTAAGEATERRPVFVWIYGGGYTGGASSIPMYDGAALARTGAVVVTFNYRLGSLGFMAHPELTRESGRQASGNYGIMDALAALGWVQRNIASFGGDPGNVSIAGESAGATIVALLVASPQGKGLFRRAIAQSSAWVSVLPHGASLTSAGGQTGIGVARMTTRAAAEAAAVTAFAGIGASTLAQARSLPADEVLRQVRGTRPIVDGFVLSEDPVRTFGEGRQNPVDVLLGSNGDEGTFFPRPQLTAAEFSTEARARFGPLADRFLALYPAGSDAEAARSYLASVTDVLTWHMRHWAAAEAARGHKAYVFFFTRHPPTAPGQVSRGATHVAEVPYMFNNLAADRPWQAVDRRLADQMARYWVNFTRTGDPNGTGLPAWPAFTDLRGGRALVLDEQVAPEPQPFSAEKAAFFEEVYRVGTR